MIERLEGRTSVLAALEARRRRFEVILISEKVEAPEVEAAAATLKVPVRRVKPDGLDKMAHARSHGGIIALCTPKPLVTPAQIKPPDPAFLLLLDGIDDARNLGYVLRTADAMGVHAVLLRRRAWDFDSGDVSRASSGAFERMDIALVEEVSLPGITLLGCLANAGTSIDETDLTGPVTVAIGGEKRGLSRAVRDRCDGFMKIPTRPGASSLSLSHAAAIVLAEVGRQRRCKTYRRTSGV